MRSIFFLQQAKAAPLQVRSPPAVEAEGAAHEWLQEEWFVKNQLHRKSPATMQGFFILLHTKKSMLRQQGIAHMRIPLRRHQYEPTTTVRCSDLLK